MPVEKAKGGERWGKSGKVYRGKGAAAKARKQGVAIMISQGKIKPKGKAKNTTESAVDPSNIAPRKVERDVLEFMRQDRPCRVDRDKGIIYGVHLCGLESKNGGRYPVACLEAACEMYEGAKCNINHPDRSSPGKDRLVDDRFGVFHNPTIGQDGAYADLHFLKSHRLAEMVCESAERMPEALGFSQNARTIQVPDGTGGTIHESITRVRSVDLVADPATTGSIFESEQQDMNDPHTQGMAPDDTVPEEQPVVADEAIEADPVDVAIDALLGQYLPTIRDAGTDSATRKTALKELQKKIEAIVKALSEESEEPAEEASEDTGAEEDEEKPVEESAKEPVVEPIVEKPAKVKPDYEQALDVLESAQVQPTAIRIKALLAVPVEDRQALAGSWPKQATTAAVVAKPKSSSVLESYRAEEHDMSKAAAPTAEQLKDDATLLMSASR